jgi:alpha-tubulin suppressor-like RCC1 family protein
MRAACWQSIAAVLVAACTQDLRVLDRESDGSASASCMCGEGDLCWVDHCLNPAGITSLAVGYRHVCRVSDGQLACWGENRSGQLGLSDTEMRRAPEPVGDSSSWLSVSAAEEHTCAIAAPGRLYCWGNNASGQLGTRNDAAQRLPTRVAGYDDWERVFTGGESSCGLRDDGLLYCWGATGQLIVGTGDVDTPEIVNQPIEVMPEARFKDVSLGARHTCVIRTDGALLCWGQNGDGQLGIGNATPMTKQPTAVARTGWQQIAAGHHHSCGVRQGELFCWGRGDSLELGTGNRRASSTPVRVGEDSDWASVAVGMSHSCAIKRSHFLYCWGRNGDAQLGVTPSEPVGMLTPVKPETRFGTIAIGSQHSCALDTGQTLYCWGANDQGQLGTDDSMPRFSPALVD